MQLTVVGCSGSTSGPDSPASSYLVQAPFEGRTFSLVLDLGPGAFGALYQYLPPEQVDAIALSHLHPDHCLDVCAYYVAATYSPTAPWPRIPVYGPAGSAERLARAYEGGDRPDPPIATHFRYETWSDEQTVGPFRVRTTRVDHPIEAYAIRVTELATDADLTYSGDTGPCAALIDLASGTDLLLIESAYLDGDDNPPGFHLTGTQAAAVGVAAGVQWVVLTHIPPWHDPARVLAEATANTTIPTELASSGARWTIGEPRSTDS